MGLVAPAALVADVATNGDPVMAALWYTFSARGDGGTRLTGLRPGWSLFRDVASNADVLPLPAISEVGLGIYRFAYDAESGGDAVGQIDLLDGPGAGGPIVLGDEARYIDVYLTRESGRLMSSVSVDGGMRLAPSGLDAVTIEVGTNARQALSLIAAAAAGMLSGAGTDTVVIRGVGTDAMRIGAIVDAAGNRASVTATPPE